MQHEALRMIRQFHNLSLTETAERIGVSKSFLSQIENGHKTPSLDFLETFAKAFNMPTSSILLFAETVGKESAQEKVRASVAGITLKLLKWVEKNTTDGQSGSDK